MATAPLDRDAILRIIESWPIEEQVTLARAILEHAAHPTRGPSATPARSTWDALYGIASPKNALGMLATPGHPAPTDEKIERWRMEKYGEPN